MDTDAPALPPIVIGKAPSPSKIITDLLCRPEGATRAELMSALRWPSINVPKQVANLGLAVTKTFRNGVPVFHASAPTETPLTDNVVAFPVVEPEQLASEPVEARQPSAPEAQPSRARLVSEFIRLGVELMENGDRSPLKLLESVLDS